MGLKKNSCLQQFKKGVDMAKKEKFYAVKVGVKPGIYRDWEECRKNVIGFAGAVYKSFESLKEAEDWLAQSGERKEIPKDVKENEVLAYVDGSFLEKVPAYGYGAVLLTKNGKETKKGFGDNRKWLPLRNVAGEILGVITAVSWALKKKYKKINIVYDYSGLEHWANNEWKTNTAVTKHYRSFIQKSRKKIDIEFFKVKGHTGVELNEEADKLAKEGIQIYVEKMNLNT